MNNELAWLDPPWAFAAGSVSMWAALYVMSKQGREARWRAAEAEAREQAQRIAYGRVERARRTETALLRAQGFRQAATR